MPTERDLLGTAELLITTALDHPDMQRDLSTLTPGALARMARDVASVRSVQLAQEHLELARLQRTVQDEQLRLQTLAFGPLQPMVDLVEEISKAADGNWDAAKVNRWVRTAAELNDQVAKS